MDIGFPIHLISVLRCADDGSALSLDQHSQLSENRQLVQKGVLLCSACCRAFPIENGILNLLDADAMDEESQRELTIRDERASKTARAKMPAWYDNDFGRAELIPTLDAVSAGPGQMVLELGCGDGRYTLILAGQCSWVVAVDFSLESLRTLQQRPQHYENIALVLGDITALKVQSKTFDRVLSTLVSNLPSRAHRDAMYRLAAAALKPGGRFVFSTHYHGLWQRLSGESQSGRYKESGIYRYYFTLRECRAEAGRFFSLVTARTIQFHLPFAGRLGLPLVKISRMLESFPLLNRLGHLILCTAEQPTNDGASYKQDRS